MLNPAEAEAFLEHVFSAVARRPKPLTLRGGAGVAKYLKALAWEAPPGPVHELLERVSDIIWGTILVHAPIDTAGRQVVLDVLEAHRHTYLSGINHVFDLEGAINYVRQATPPDRPGSLCPPPRLMSYSLATHGAGNPQRGDDLSERIYAAYYALRRARLQDARKRIAAVLNKLGLRLKARPNSVSDWGPYEVYERVKQYEQSQLRRFGKSLGVQRFRSVIVDLWLFRFNDRTG